MKFIPILFSTPMIQAIQAGRKSQTRRIVKPQPIDNTEVDGNFFEGSHKGYVKVDGHPNWREQFVYEFCKYSVRDVLWVREKWRKNDTQTGYPYHFYADDNVYTNKDNEKWRPSIFMPKHACRLFLEVTEVKIERLQDISEKDAMSEGLEFKMFHDIKWYRNYKSDSDVFIYGSPEKSFQSLWQKINGEESWRSNPFVWCISFKRIEKPSNFQ